MLLGSLEGQNYALIPCILEVCRADNIIESNGYGFLCHLSPTPRGLRWHGSLLSIALGQFNFVNDYSCIVWHHDTYSNRVASYR